ncbi:MAG: LptE family protein [Planctomycetota bacterium]
MRALSAAALLAALLGCGYTQGSLIAEGNRRVAVPIFDNDTFYREMEFELTRTVVAEIERRPGVQVVREADADVILKGRITDLRQQVLSEDERDRVRESTATITVTVDLVDPHTGKVRKHFEVKDVSPFAAARGETLVTAQRESFLELARRIVWQLEEPF